jgi:diaminobutyrate-2-oxoglutarate transaminase
VVPDIVTLSKSISGYGLPLALCLFRPELDVWAPGEHTGTFRGNQLAFIAGAAAFELWRRADFRTNLVASSRRLDRFATELRRLDPSLVTRGRGMVLGIDTGLSGGAARARRVQRRCFDHGLIIELCGREDEVVKVMPPLTIAPAELEKGLGILLNALVRAPQHALVRTASEEGSPPG